MGGPVQPEGTWRMPRRTPQAPSISRPRRSRKITYDQKLAYISQYKRISDTSDKRSIDKLYRTYKKFPLYLQKSANKEQRAELKRRGFFTTDKGVIIDGPRDARRQPIKGAKFQILSDGVVKYSTKQRRDYIIGFTKAEKKEFAANPAAFVRQKEKEFRENHPNLKIRGSIQTRLQWGAYQATKDFTPSSFSNRYPYIESKVKGQAIQDRMTGLHIVVHVTKGKS